METPDGILCAFGYVSTGLWREGGLATLISD